MRILPGYDFGLNEIPTHEKFMQAARGLRIVEASFTDLQTGFRGVLTGGTSGASGSLLPNTTGVGMCWMDAQSNLWVQEKAGAVKLVRYEGGWESRRAHISLDNVDAAWRQPGVSWWVDNTGAPNERWSEDFGRSEDPVNSRSSGVQLGAIDIKSDLEIFQGLLMDSCGSGYHRWLGRGLGWLRDQDHVTNTQNKLRDMQNNWRLWRPNEGAANETFRKEYATIALLADRYYGWACAPGDASTKVSQADGDHIWRVQWATWFFGSPMGISPTVSGP